MNDCEERAIMLNMQCYIYDALSPDRIRKYSVTKPESRLAIGTLSRLLQCYASLMFQCCVSRCVAVL